MLSSFRVSRQFVAAAALAFGAVGFTPALSGAGGKPAPAKAVPTVNYDTIFNSEKFKFLQDYILEESVRPNLTDEFLRNGAKAGIKKYLETLPAGGRVVFDTLFSSASSRSEISSVASKLNPSTVMHLD